MMDMKQLATLVKELEDQLAVCMRCGMCQAVCPVYAERRRAAKPMWPAGSSLSWTVSSGRCSRIPTASAIA